MAGAEESEIIYFWEETSAIQVVDGKNTSRLGINGSSDLSKPEYFLSFMLPWNSFIH